MKDRKKLTLVPIGGLANRLYAITSAIAFCEDYDIDLKVVWFKDWGMGADFHALFELVGDHPHVEIVDATWKDYIYDRPRKRNFWLPYLYQKFAYGQCVYESKVNKGFSSEDLISFCKSYGLVYLVHYCSFYDCDPIRFVRPCKEILGVIEQRKKNFQMDEHVIGMHIRRTDNTDSIKHSPLALFIDKIQQEIEIDPDARFYVASDDLNEKRRLKEIFGDRIITPWNEVRRDTVEGIKDAVIELYTLASTKKIYGSVHSSYSQLAALLGHIDITILKGQKGEI
ncbi:MAG: hypothetical protein ACI3ZY_12785 [Parabacteroides sp.]